MPSESSDDEPLSNLAAAKKINPEKFKVPIYPDLKVRNQLKRKKRRKLKLNITFGLSKSSKNVPLSEPIERPQDVWLYLKDFRPIGPYSCLLCSEWFINRSKIALHYIVNHQKDYCSICRYFVPGREAWVEHQKFHSPWPCSQCSQLFETLLECREHLSSVHDMVHCRFCHFLVPDNDQYNSHLLKKHNVTNILSKNADLPFDFEVAFLKFKCLLCSKSNYNSKNFFNHMVSYHHISLKCMTNILSGKDFLFSVSGIDVSASFVSSLKEQGRFGYVDYNPYQNDTTNQIDPNNEVTDLLLKALVPEVKQEVISENEQEEEMDEYTKESLNEEFNAVKKYRGIEDFDVTQMELITLNNCYLNYANQVLQDIISKTISKKSDIDYDSEVNNTTNKTQCCLCSETFDNQQTFDLHLTKMHNIRIVSLYSCRVCATSFDSLGELDNHTQEELGDFTDLWLCQFCDLEFDSRPSTRFHLSEHWASIKSDNCFSPHLGFKCKYCPVLFWNEVEREKHQVEIHFKRHKEDFYKCQICSEILSDKLWFTHHVKQNHAAYCENQPYLLKCCNCCLVLSSIDEMRNHFNTEHPEAKKIFCCLDSCKYKPLCHRKSFQLHLRNMHNPIKNSDRLCTCKVCSREFVSARACRIHMGQAHSAVGRLQCKICNEPLQSVDERKLHYLVQHPGHHPYRCNECGKSFLNKSTLYTHKQTHNSPNQYFTCPQCGKTFAKKDSFREHLMIHEGPRHACSYCPMRFVQKSNMLRHERRHTGEKPYTCEYCPKTFSDKGACNSHTRNNNNQKYHVKEWPISLLMRRLFWQA